ncbi:unnamed protein product [Rotaria sp. Silwood2]|nr:unnamed protein product [Rotaria sp. Silwood2]
MRNNDPQYCSKSSQNVFDKLSNKISAIRGDINVAVKERRRSISSDRQNSMSSTSSLATMNIVAFSLHDDTSSITMQTRELSKKSGEYQFLELLAIACITFEPTLIYDDDAIPPLVECILANAFAKCLMAATVNIGQLLTQEIM